MIVNNIERVQWALGIINYIDQYTEHNNIEGVKQALRKNTLLYWKSFLWKGVGGGEGRSSDGITHIGKQNKFDFIFRLIPMLQIA